ncbi:MAG: aminotransferase class I/II-fold pyridoxal phosphate-dependent enzyme, partial [Candidatus Eremiobacteraeota bacterium]|nr:aminotransferase class I/II-fold pyridoxal phosphate-dependent enzyme [Candidatus Eremiobacteraeota bacterium]
MDFDTLLLDGDGGGDALSPPIYQTTAFRASSQSEFRETARSDRPERFYTRYGNPTLERVASLLAQLEGAEAGLLCASGMGAISTTLLSLVRCGDHIVAQRNLYTGTVDLLEKLLSRFGVATTFVDAGDLASIERAIVDRTVLVYVETPSNPLLRVVDLQAVSQMARARNVLTVCDNTFATPINQRPLEWGIDLVVHGATKYLSGHSDVMAGAIVGTKAAIDRAWETSLTLGATLGAIDAWLLLRGLRTLALRVVRHNENALALARFLRKHRRVASVYYPGLDTHPE